MMSTKLKKVVGKANQRPDSQRFLFKKLCTKILINIVNLQILRPIS